MRLPILGVNKILAIASGKGGVGKTTMTVHLALALAQTGACVGVFDADVYGPNVPLLLGVHRRQPASGKALVAIARTDSTPYIEPLMRYGLKVMSMGLLVGESDAVLADSKDVGPIVTQTLRDVLWAPLDYLLLDLPPGSGEPHQTLLRVVQLDGVIVVTTPQDLSLLDAGRQIKAFVQADVPILDVIENMSYLHCPHCGEPIEVFERTEQPWVVRDESLELLGRVPMSLAISRHITADHPLLNRAPDSEDARIFHAIARRVRDKVSA